MNSSLISNYKSQLQELIDGAQSIGIIVGENQNLDMLGASLGLYLALKSSGKNVQIVSKKPPVVEHSNLFGIDKIMNAFDGQTKILTISVPYREGEIEKVSYNIEENKLNVNLFAESNRISFNENEINYIRKGSSPSLVIAIGISSEAELSETLDIKSVKLITIDKSPLNSIQGDVTIVDPNFSSVSEIVANIVRELGLAGDPDSFQNLMDGITYATRNFTNPTTSAVAFEAAGFLLANGARRKERTQENKQRDNRFPAEDQFLNRKPRFNKGQGQQRVSNQGQPAPSEASRGGNQPQNRQNFQNLNQSQPKRQNEQQNTKPIANYSSFQEPQAPKENPVVDKSFDTPQDDIVGSSAPGDLTPGDIPDDWFLPKVFKGSKKGQQN